MTGCTVAGNSAGASGGGLCAKDNGWIHLTGCTFEANKAEKGDGGAVYVAKSPSGWATVLVASGCTFKSNAAAHLGGGVYNGNGSLDLTDSKIDANRTLAQEGDGAGVFNSNGRLVASASTFSNNDATVRGGGLDNENGGTATLDGCTFMANQAVYGAGIDNGTKSTLTMVNSSELDNNSSRGGGRYRNDSSGGGLFTSGDTVLIASTIASNSVASYGGGIEESGGMTIATNCTIARNYSEEVGAGILVKAGTINLMNCTVAQNTKGQNYFRGTGIGLFVATGVTADVVNTAVVDNLFPSNATQFSFYIGNVQGTIRGQNNEIQSASQWNYRYTVVGSLSNNGGPTLTMALLPGSPAIGTGAPPSSSNPNVPTVDQRGEPRNSVTDIGAYQYSGNPKSGNDLVSTLRRRNSLFRDSSLGGVHRGR